jgi:DNA topoisomerase IB
MESQKSYNSEKLKEMIDKINPDDNTEFLREEKPSQRILADVETILKIKMENGNSKTHELLEQCKTSAKYMYNHYTAIFHKVFKDEIDMYILNKLLDVLKLIEDRKMDQHEGSVNVGELLKQIYIDKAILPQINTETKDPLQCEEILNYGDTITWKEYKNK